MTDERDQFIHTLALEPHPEGGWFRQVYRSTSDVHPPDSRGTRSSITAIYYLLAAGEISRWHRVQSDEIWYLLEGGPLHLYVASPGFSTVERHRLDRIGTGAQPWFAVPAGWWQAAQPAGSFALASCVVAPGFEYADFALLANDPGSLEAAAHLTPEQRQLI